MITDDEKRKAWGTLGDRIARGLVPWPDYMSQEQIDYLTTCIRRSANPGEIGKYIRNIIRWVELSTAFDIIETRHPGKSKNALYKDVAGHYGISWTTVRKTRRYVENLGMTLADRARLPGVAEIDLASLELPHINFDNFPEE